MVGCTEFMAKTYRCTIEVRGYELDSYGHVNHAVYVSYLEHARWKMLEEEGITLSKFQEWKRWPVIANIEVKYLRPAFAGEKLEVETCVIENRRVGFSLSQRITRGETKLLEAKITSVIVNESGRPTEIPKEMMEAWKRS